jgi:hypothetical protein
LSKFSRMRSSRVAHASTSGSLIPGAAFLSHTARHDIVVSYSGVICHDVSFLPSVGHQSDHKFDRKPGPADDRLAGQHGRIERDAWMPCSHYGLPQPL